MTISQSNQHQSHRTTADFSHIDTYERALNGVLTVTSELGIAHRRAVLEFARVLGRMKQLVVDEGASEPAMRAGFELVVSGMIDDLFASEQLDFEVLRRIESEHDRAEDALQDLIGIRGLTPVMLEDWGKAQILASASSKACGRRAVALARKMRNDIEVQRQIIIDRLNQQER